MTLTIRRPVRLCGSGLAASVRLGRRTGVRAGVSRCIIGLAGVGRIRTIWAIWWGCVLLAMSGCMGIRRWRGSWGGWCPDLRQSLDGRALVWLTARIGRGEERRWTAASQSEPSHAAMCVVVRRCGTVPSGSVTSAVILPGRKGKPARNLPPDTRQVECGVGATGGGRLGRGAWPAASTYEESIMDVVVVWTVGLLLVSVLAVRYGKVRG